MFKNKITGRSLTTGETRVIHQTKSAHASSSSKDAKKKHQTLTANALDDILRIWIEKVINSPPIITVDRNCFSLIGIDVDRMTNEKAYSKAKKILRKVGTILNQDPHKLEFSTQSCDFAVASLRFGPPELREKVYNLVKQIYVGKTKL